MSEKRNEFLTYLNDRKMQVNAEVKALAEDGRTDDSNILKAKANIYDIAKAFFDNVTKGASEGSEKEAFLKAFGRVTGQWEATYEKAKAFGDDRQVLVEEAKFSAVTEIKEKLEELF